MNITKHDIDSLNAEITIAVGPEDYESKLNEGLKKVQKKISMPGFRPGKVPASLVKKQYGTQILVDEINKLLSENINKYIEENQIGILGNPLPKDQASVDFVNQKDFEFVYQLGLAPEFKLKLNNETVFTFKTVKIDDTLIDKYIKDVKRSFGKPAHPEVSGDKDVLFVDLNELDETGSIKPGGIFKNTSVNNDRLKNEKAKTKLTGVKKEDKIIVNVNDLYETALDKSVSLGISKEEAENTNCDVQLTVKNISRMDDAELNQELFDKVYGEGKVNSEEEFRKKISEELAMMFSGDSERFFKKEVENKLINETDIRLPDDFLKRWLRMANEKPLTQEEVERDYPDYAKAMKWRLIENRIIKDHSIKVSESEATEEAKSYVRREYARHGQAVADEDLEKISKSLLEKEAEKIFQGLYDKKVLEFIKDKCTLEIKEVDYNDFFKG